MNIFLAQFYINPQHSLYEPYIALSVVQALLGLRYDVLSL